MNRKFMRTVFVAMAMMAITAVLFITGCGGGDDSTPANVAGTWSGPVTMGSESFTMTSVLTQDGKNVSGTMNKAGESGPLAVSGVVDGNSVALTGTGQHENTYVFEMTVNDETMSGTFVVTGLGDEVTGTVNFTRVATGA